MPVRRMSVISDRSNLHQIQQNHHGNTPHATPHPSSHATPHPSTHGTLAGRTNSAHKPGPVKVENTYQIAPLARPTQSHLKDKIQEVICSIFPLSTTTHR